MALICRLCLKCTPTYIGINTFNHIENSRVSVSTLVTALVPELYLGISVDPVVCKCCYIELRRAYVFRQQCLRSENLIGTYVRKTKTTTSTISLKDVLEFWLKHPQNVPQEMQINLKEWQMNLTQWQSMEKDQFVEPESEVEPNNQKIKNILSLYEQEVNDSKADQSSKLGSTQEKISLCKCSDTYNCLYCKSNNSKEKKGKINEDQNIDDIDNTVVGNNASAVLDDIITEVLEGPKKKVPAISLREVPACRTYTKKPKAVPKQIVKKESPKVDSDKFVQRINLVGDLEDEDISSLIEELSKDENLKKLGFSASDKQETYSLQKFIDKSDNALSFALLPQPSTVIGSNNAVKEQNVVDSDDAIKGDVESDDAIKGQDAVREVVERDIREAINIKWLDSMRGRIKSVMGPDKEQDDNVAKVGDISKTERDIASKGNGTDPEQEAEEKACSENSEAAIVSSLLKDRLEGGNNVPNNIQVGASSNAEPVLKENDEKPKSDGETTGHPTDPPPSTSEEKPAMPIIRVRPVSALQNVRTLNHELWPQGPGLANFEKLMCSSKIYKMPTKVVKSQPTGAPIVLNSKLGPSSDLVASINLLPSQPKIQKLKAYIKKTKEVASRPVRVRARVDFFERLYKMEVLKRLAKPHSKQSDISPKEDILNGPSPASSTDSITTSPIKGEYRRRSPEKKVKSTSTSQTKGEDRRRSPEKEIEEAIDIKEEPLDCTESDVLMNFGDDGRNSTDSESDKTRSASETSFMDSFGAESELVKTIMENMPEMGDDQYDEPEYIHINKVTYSDLAKLVDESKKHINKIQVPTPESNLYKDLPRVRPISFNTDLRRTVLRKIPQFRYSSHMPEEVTPRNLVQTKKSRKRIRGKRLRLIQVDTDGVEIPEVSSTTRKRVNKRSTLKNIGTGTAMRQRSLEDMNTCVLFTTFTSEGDYINDHDYLMNPYKRNKMYYNHAGATPVCMCLLCDFIHQARDHIDHMKSHRTVCQVCQIDFHNTFILNLHVKSHSTFCKECNISVSYAGYITHAQMHNRSVNLSNIDLPDNIIENYLNKPETPTSQTEKEKEPPPCLENYNILKDLLSESSEKQAPNISLRRSRRITRSRNPQMEAAGVDEEEACIYDKTTKSFITPTAIEQQKLLEHHKSDKEKTEPNKISQKANIDADGDRHSQGAEKTDRTETPDMVNKLLCEESFEEETESETSCIKTDLFSEGSRLSNVSTGLTDIRKEEPKETGMKTRKKRYSAKSTAMSTKSEGNGAVLKSAQSVSCKTRNSSKSDLSEPSDGKITEKVKETCKSQGIEEDDNESSSDSKTLEELRNNINEKKSTRRGVADKGFNKCASSKHGLTGSVNKADLVKSHSKPDRKRKRITNNTEITNSPSPMENARDPATIKLHGSVKNEEKIQEKINTKRFTPKLLTNQTGPMKTLGSKKTANLKQRKKEPSKTENSDSSNPKSPTNSATIDSSKTETAPETELAGTSQEEKPKGNLKMKIKGLHFNPFVSLTNIGIPKTNVKQLKPMSKACERSSKKRKRDANESEDIIEEIGTAGDINREEFSDVTPDVKESVEEKPNETLNESLLNKGDDNKKDLRPNLGASSKARSSRSRGRSSLVEGLVFSEKRCGSKTMKKSVQDSVDSVLDRSVRADNAIQI